MSTLEPMSEASLREIAGNCASETSVLSRVVATALHHLARDSARRERDEAKAASGWIAEPTQQTVLDILGIAAGDRVDVIGRIKALVGAERERDRMLRSEADVCSILGARPDELLADAAQRITGELDFAETAEAEPAQTFHPPISITVRHASGHAFAEVLVGAISDPAFLALPMGARLALVVTRG